MMYAFFNISYVHVCKKFEPQWDRSSNIDCLWHDATVGLTYSDFHSQIVMWINEMYLALL